MATLFVDAPVFEMDESGVTFLPNIGFFSIPWRAKANFIPWPDVEEYWFHGARNVGEQSMGFSAYALSFKVRNHEVPEMVNLGPMRWSYPELKEVIENYTRHAVVGGN